MTNNNIKEINGKRFYHFTTCGLPNIYLATDTRLAGVTIKEINGEQFVSINDLHQLHKVISHKLCYKPKAFSSNEFKFLRKELDTSVEDMSLLTGLEIDKIYNIEKGQNYLYSYDMMIRSMIVLLYGFERISTYSKFLSTLSTFGQDDVTLFLMYKEGPIVDEGYWQILDSKI